MPGAVWEAGRWLKRARLRVGRALARDKATWNARLNQRELWHGRVRLRSFPREIQVGTNWTCNLRCFFCRRETVEKERLRGLSREERELAPETLERLLEVMPFVEVFTLTPLGEPLLYSGLDRLLERCRAARRRNLQLTTNGNAIDEALARRLVEAGVNRIMLSIDSADPQTYAAMRVGGSLDRVTRGLRLLNEWKARLGVERPEVVFTSTFLRQNIGDLPGLARYAAEHGVRLISVQLMEAEAPEIEPETLAHHLPLTLRALEEARRVAEDCGVTLRIHEALRNLLSASEATPETARLLAAEPTLDTRGKSLLEKCQAPWSTLVVDTDGDVRPCCWASLSYGNLARQPFDEVWNGAAAQALRRTFLAGRLPAGCRGKHCRVDL